MNWEFYSARRKVSLEEFTKKACNLYEAKQIFKNASIDLPVDNSLEVLFEGTADSAPEEAQTVDLSTDEEREERSETATSNWLESASPAPETSKSLPKTSVDYLEMGVKPSKEEGSDDDKSSDTKS